MAVLRDVVVGLMLCIVLGNDFLHTQAQEIQSSKCLLPKDAGDGLETVDYYYFDRDSKSCVLAQFTSSPGNLNYFQSKAVCQKTCAKYFVTGSPKCLAPKAPGDCSGSQDVYYFDQDTKACEFATFSSCPGNRNVFKVKSVCESTCAPFLEKTPDRASSKCLLPKDLGDCEGTNMYYYFDKTAKMCKIAEFSGCPGNLNYFRFKSACEKTCAPYFVRGAPKCLSPMDPGTCEGQQEMFYFDQETKTCLAGTFSACPGNLNYFRFKSSCENTCARYMGEPTEGEVSSKRSAKCLLPKDEGTCPGSRQFFYFDQATKSCQLGSFTKCPGNLNYFRVQSVCENTCAPYYTRASKKCMKPMDPGTCEGTKEYYYFDQETRSCVSGTFSSCPGNINYFEQKSGCESLCAPFMT